MFPPLLGDSMHVPFFSIEDAPGWMTARGYTLYQELNLAECLDPLRGHRYTTNYSPVKSKVEVSADVQSLGHIFPIWQAC
jgi:hypothetical protein